MGQLFQTLATSNTVHGPWEKGICKVGVTFAQFSVWEHFADHGAKTWFPCRQQQPHWMEGAQIRVGAAEVARICGTGTRKEKAAFSREHQRSPWGFPAGPYLGSEWLMYRMRLQVAWKRATDLGWKLIRARRQRCTMLGDSSVLATQSGETSVSIPGVHISWVRTTN